ncbi:MAG: o-succinylbenzoate synthase [Candidatus Marinimicrobia bacterium]|nr:o-succinylbenzoate synthase [Candidatus Neomarinimicrobiota bacterium]
MELHTLSLRFRKQFQNRKSGFQTRDLLIAEISNGSLTGFGEIAPLPGYSRESLTQARDQFVGISQQIEVKELVKQAPSNILENILNLDLYPSVEFGVLSALLDLRAKSRKFSIHRLLSAHTVKSIRCNALIGLENRNETAHLASEAAKNGFHRVKLKFGRPEFGKDLEALQAAVDAAGPDILFRLDVNGGWEYAQAQRHLHTLADYPIDYIEQPLPAEQLDQLTQLQFESTIPIALDESIISINRWETFFKQSPVRTLVIKPMIHGLFFLSPAFQTLTETETVRVIISSSFESPVGHAFLCQLAAAVAPDEFHGLSTLDLFEKSSKIGNGYLQTGERIRLPDETGLGMDIPL